MHKALIAATVLTLLISASVDPATPPEGTARLAPDIIKQAHRYHGILISEEDAKGYFFVRDGVRCRLLTDAFLASYRGNVRAGSEPAPTNKGKR